jgi:hypothetical protein
VDLLHGRNITPTDLAHNDLHFKTQYNPAKPIGTLFSQIKEAMDYAGAGSNAYTANQIISNAYNLSHHRHVWQGMP